jgi:hypothetical protein
MLKLQCQCGKKLRAPVDAAGKKFNCPNCGTPMVVPKGNFEAPSDDLFGANSWASLDAVSSTAPPHVASFSDLPAFTAVQATFEHPQSTTPKPSSSRINIGQPATEYVPSPFPWKWVTLGLLCALLYVSATISLSVFWITPMLRTGRAVTLSPNDLEAKNRKSGSASENSLLPPPGGYPATLSSPELVKETDKLLGLIFIKIAELNSEQLRMSAESDLIVLRTSLDDLKRMWERQTETVMLADVSFSDRSRLAGLVLMLERVSQAKVNSEGARLYAANAMELGRLGLEKIDSAKALKDNPTAHSQQAESRRNHFDAPLTLVDWSVGVDSPALAFDHNPTLNYRVDLTDTLGKQSPIPVHSTMRDSNVQIAYAWPYRPVMMLYFIGDTSSKAVTYDLRTGRVITEMVGPKHSQLNAAALNFNGTQLLCQRDGAILLFEENKPQPIFNQQVQGPHFLFFSNNADADAVNASGRNYFSALNGHRRYSMTESLDFKDAIVHEGEIKGMFNLSEENVALSPSGRYIGVPHAAGENYMIYDTHTWKVAGQIVPPPECNVDGACFSATGEYLYVLMDGKSDRMIYKLHLPTGEVKASKHYDIDEWRQFDVREMQNGRVILEPFPGDMHLFIGNVIFDATRFKFERSFPRNFSRVRLRPISASQVIQFSGGSFGAVPWLF